MDNQQLNPKQGRVQRSSRKRVLDLKKFIVWETPCIKNKIYIYKLSSSKDLIPRYVGLTTNPLCRLSHHTSKSYQKNNYKSNWINSILNKDFHIIMTVFDSEDTLEKALIKEERYINNILNLTNHELNPITPSLKKCYLYNIYTSEQLEFISHQSAAQYLNISNGALYKTLIKSCWLYSKNKNIDLISRSKIKARNIITNEILYFITQQQASLKLNCSKSMINLCCMKQRKSVNGWQVIKIKDIFSKYVNNHNSKVICTNDNNIFNTIKEAALFYKIDESCIVKVCKGIRKHVKKLNFKYYDDMIHLYEKS